MTEEKTLLLDQAYTPLKVVSWQRAITLLTLQKVEIISSYDKEVRSTSIVFKMPAVARLIKAFKRHKKPVFLYKKMEEESHGTVRSVKEINSVSLMKNCSKYFLTFGGHPQASGFRTKNENLEKIKKCLTSQL